MSLVFTRFEPTEKAPSSLETIQRDIQQDSEPKTLRERRRCCAMYGAPYVGSDAVIGRRVDHVVTENDVLHVRVPRLDAHRDYVVVVFIATVQNRIVLHDDVGFGVLIAIL